MLHLFPVYALLLTLSEGKTSNSIYMESSKFDDQAASASGYVIRSDGEGPISYATYGQSSNFQQPGAYSVHGLPLAGLPYQQQPVANGYAIHGLPIPVYPLQGVVGHQQIHQNPVVEIDKTIQPAAQNIIAQTHINGAPTLLEGKIIPYGPPAIYDESSGQHFSKGGGEQHDSSKHAAHGEKGNTGYKSQHAHDNAAKGHHENQHHKGHYNHQGGNAASHHDQGGHYAKKEEASHGAKGGSYGQSSGHKKGHKTTGFHKVYHKDEYKKDHSFYDEADNRGHFNKYDNFNGKHSSEKGGFEKGGHSVEGHEESESGKKGFVDNGKFSENDSGYKGVEGEDAYHNDQEEYGKKSGQEKHLQEGFSKHEGSKYYH